MKICTVLILTFVISQQAISGQLVKTHFGKSIDLQDWSDKMSMPLDELVNEIQKKVVLYRFQRENDISNDKSAAIMRLPQVPTNIYKYYFKDIALGGAVGIYMPVRQLQFLIDKPTLLLREDTKHWTLIHEYTHHLFNEARELRNENLPEGYLTTYEDHTETLQESYERFIKNGQKFKDQTHLNEYLLCVKVSSQIRIKMILQFELEEIVIETMIRNFYHKNKNINFEPDYFDNSSIYIETNLNRVNTSINGFLHFLEIALESIDQKNLNYSELKSSFDQLKNLQKQIKNFKK